MREKRREEEVREYLSVASFFSVWKCVCMYPTVSTPLFPGCLRVLLPVLFGPELAPPTHQHPGLRPANGGGDSWSPGARPLCHHPLHRGYQSAGRVHPAGFDRKGQQCDVSGPVHDWMLEAEIPMIIVSFTALSQENAL